MSDKPVAPDEPVSNPVSTWSNIAEQLFRLPSAAPTETINRIDSDNVSDQLISSATTGDTGWKLPFALRMQLSRIGAVLQAPGKGVEFKVDGFSFDGQNRQEQIDALKKFKSPVDYKTLLDKGARVALFGETHTNDAARDELIDNMADFKKLGFSHISLEALPSNRQPLIDDYYAGKATRQQVLDALKEDWGWNPESYMRLIDSAKAHGLKTICLDVKIPKEQAEKWREEGKYTEDSRVREEHWAKIMNDHLAKDPEARILTLAGKGHTGIDHNQERWLTSLLNKAGHKPTVIDLAGGNAFGFDSAFEKAVDAAGLNGERFMIPVWGKGAFRPSDFVVHLPEMRRFPFLERPRFDLDKIPYQYRIRPDR